VGVVGGPVERIHDPGQVGVEAAHNSFLPFDPVSGERGGDDLDNGVLRGRIGPRGDLGASLGHDVLRSRLPLPQNCATGSGCCFRDGQQAGGDGHGSTVPRRSTAQPVGSSSSAASAAKA
jgi:hypothetical protein